MFTRGGFWHYERLSCRRVCIPLTIEILEKMKNVNRMYIFKFGDTILVANVTRLRVKADKTCFVYLRDEESVEKCIRLRCELFYTGVTTTAPLSCASSKTTIDVYTHIPHPSGYCWGDGACEDKYARLWFLELDKLYTAYKNYFNGWGQPMPLPSITPSAYLTTIDHMRRWIADRDSVKGTYLEWLPRDVRLLIVDILDTTGGHDRMHVGI
jgi:hypothetical protein